MLTTHTIIEFSMKPHSRADNFDKLRELLIPEDIVPRNFPCFAHQFDKVLVWRIAAAKSSFFTAPVR